MGSKEERREDGRRDERQKGRDKRERNRLGERREEKIVRKLHWQEKTSYEEATT